MDTGGTLREPAPVSGTGYYLPLIALKQRFANLLPIIEPELSLNSPGKQANLCLFIIASPQNIASSDLDILLLSFLPVGAFPLLYQNQSIALGSQLSIA